MKRILAALAVASALLLGACGDDATDTSSDLDATGTSYDPSASGVTGTVPLPGPISWLEWAPGESPDADSEAALVAGLEELGKVMIIPASPSPTGQEIRAMVNSQSLGWGSGETFAGTTDIVLNVMVGTDTIVLLRTFGQSADCFEGLAVVTFRGNPDACAGEHNGFGTVQWQEEGQYFEASFRQGLTLEQGLAWLETWRRLP